MKQLLLIAVLFVFAITTAFVTDSTNENPDPFRRGIPLSLEEVNILRSSDSQAKRELVAVLTGEPTGTTTAYVTVCYGGPAHCHHINGTDSCDGICSDDANDGCSCYESN